MPNPRPSCRGIAELHNDVTAIEGRSGAAVHGCNDADELGEMVHVIGLAPHCKHVVGQVIDVVHHPIVGIEEYLHMPPCALSHVRMSPSKHIKETNLLIYSLVCVAMLFDVPVRRPPLTAYHTAYN